MAKKRKKISFQLRTILVSIAILLLLAWIIIPSIIDIIGK
jgi:hypothetical protein